MKYIYIILLFLYSSSLVSQTYSDIKKLDSIYFYFSKNTFQKKKTLGKNNISKDSLITYSYYKNGTVLISFKYSKFKNFDSYFSGIETYKKYEKRRFLRKNKHRIIDYNTLDKINLNSSELTDLINKKKIFIIDEAEIKGRRILIREVFSDMLNSSDHDSDVTIFQTRNIMPFYFEIQINEDFYTFLKPKAELKKQDVYILFEPSNLTFKNSYTYNQKGSKRSISKIKEQYTFKLDILNQTVFLQFTNNKRNKEATLQKKYDLFTNIDEEVLSLQDLNRISEKQLEYIFKNARNIYIVENFLNKDYVLPKLVKITTDINDFIRSNKE